MNADRRIRLWSLVAELAHGGSVTVEHVRAAVLSAAGVDHAAVTVTLPASLREMLHATDRIAAEVEELTLTLGEGPGVDALSGGPVLAADLSAPDCLARWPVFGPAAGTAAVEVPIPAGTRGTLGRSRPPAGRASV